MTVMQPIDSLFGQGAVNAQLSVKGEQFDKIFSDGFNRHERHVSAKAGLSVVREVCKKPAAWKKRGKEACQIS
jgi:hypothetical protein